MSKISIADKQEPRRERAASYQPVGDQLDAIMKGLQAIRDKKPLPQDTLDAIAAWEKVKVDIPATRAAAEAKKRAGR